MLIGCDQLFAFFIFFLQEIIYTLQRFGLELIYDIVKNLQSCDIDDTVVVWRVWNLDSYTKHSDENGGQMRARNKLVVSVQKAGLCRHLFEHSKNHSDKSLNYIYFVHNASDQRIFSSETKLILFELVVQGKNVCCQ